MNSKLKGKDTLLKICTTVPDKQLAKKITNYLLENKLAACVQESSPIKSSYIWEEEIKTENEFLLEIKTRSSLYSRVEKAIHTLHTYECPEIIACIIDYVSEEYLNWVIKTTE